MNLGTASRGIFIKMDVNSNNLTLKQDLLASELFKQRVKNSRVYSQHVYAALCENVWCRNNVFDILREQGCSYSWIEASAIVSELRDDIDHGVNYYYKSGINPFTVGSDDLLKRVEDNLWMKEGTIDNQVLKDLFELGWILLKSSPHK